MKKKEIKQIIKGAALDKLPPMQRAFCLEYLVDFNQTQAAIRAGYSKKSASCQANQLLKKPHIQQALRKYYRQEDERRVLSIEAADRKVADSLFRDLRDFCDASGIMISNPHQLPERAMAYIDGFECYQHLDKEGHVVGQTIKCKWAPSTSAADMAYRRHGAYAPDKVDTRNITLNGDAEVIFDWNQLGKRPVPDPVKERLEQETMSPEEREERKKLGKTIVQQDKEQKARREKEQRQQTSYSVDELLEDEVE